MQEKEFFGLTIMQNYYYHDTYIAIRETLSRHYYYKGSNITMHHDTINISKSNEVCWFYKDDT